MRYSSSPESLYRAHGADHAAMQANKLLSLVFVFDGRSVLLGLKKRGFGQVSSPPRSTSLCHRQL